MTKTRSSRSTLALVAVAYLRLVRSHQLLHESMTHLACGFLGVAVGFLFFMQACLVYAGSPSDPKSPLATFSSSLLAHLGAAIFGLASSLSALLGWSHLASQFLGYSVWRLYRLLS